MTVVHRWHPLCGAVLLPLLLLPCLGRAQSFTWQAGAQARLESNSNPSLQQGGAKSLLSRTASASLNTQRSTEAAQTQGDAELILAPGEGGSSTSALGRLSLRHRLTAPRETWVGSLAYRRDRTLDGAASPSPSPSPSPSSGTGTGTGTSATDVALGRSDRSVTDASLSWSHAFSERLSSELETSHGRTAYRAAYRAENRTENRTAAVGNSYALTTASAGLRYALRETTSAAATLSHTDQRPLDAAPSAARSRIDSLRLSVNEVLSESGSAGVSLSHATTTRDFSAASAVCPLPLQFCQGGIVRYVLVSTPVRTRSHDLQYSASASLRWDETTALAARLSRALTPGALGVAREDVLNLSANRSFSEATSAGLAFDLSRSLLASDRADAAPASLRTLSLNAAHRCSEQLTLSGQLQSRHYQRAAPQPGARSTVFSISLQYQGATVAGWR